MSRVFLHSSWEYKILQPLWEDWQFLLKLNVQKLYNPTITLWMFIPDKWNIIFTQKIFWKTFMETVFVIDKIWNNSNVDVLWKMNDKTTTEYYFARKSLIHQCMQWLCQISKSHVELKGPFMFIHSIHLLYNILNGLQMNGF